MPVAEQNVDLALALSDRVFILGEQGQMAWTGASADLEADPALLRATLDLAGVGPAAVARRDGPWAFMLSGRVRDGLVKDDKKDRKVAK